jgi:glycosyltransferase involved in cell wall biosynthesis
VDEARQNGLLVDSPEVIYSPFCDALLGINHIPQVITCHDLTPLYISNSRKATWRYRLWTPRHLRRARRIIAISNFVADQLIANDIAAEKIDVVLNGIAIQRPPLASPGSDNIIILARHDRNKNVAGAIEALHRLQTSGSSWQGRMIVVGRQGRQTLDLNQRQQELPNPEALVLIDHLSQDELIDQLRQAWVLASFSRMEGFDYPVMEAKAEGIPTLVSDIPVHRELHNESSLFFQLDDGGRSFAVAIEELRCDHSLWPDLARSGRSLAVKLSLERQQAQIREAIEACRAS